MFQVCKFSISFMYHYLKPNCVSLNLHLFSLRKVSDNVVAVKGKNITRANKIKEIKCNIFSDSLTA